MIFGLFLELFKSLLAGILALSDQTVHHGGETVHLIFERLEQRLNLRVEGEQMLMSSVRFL
jgi:hypothetical protein